MYIHKTHANKRTTTTRLVRDPASNAFRGFGFVELGSVEAAEHVVRQSLGLREVRCQCVSVCVGGRGDIR